MTEKEKAVLEVSSLATRASITAEYLKAKLPFIEIIAGMEVTGESKACMKALLCILPFGADKPLRTADITQQTGINTAAIKKSVRCMRIAGIPIGSCTRGYYICVTDAEKEKFSRYMTKRIISAAKVLECFQYLEGNE